MHSVPLRIVEGPLSLFQPVSTCLRAHPLQQTIDQCRQKLLICLL